MTAVRDLARTPSIEVFDKAIDLLFHRIDLQNLHKWMVRHTTWLMTARYDAGVELAHVIELTLSEIELGHATEDDLRQAIRDWLTRRPAMTSSATYRFAIDVQQEASSTSTTESGPGPRWEDDQPLSADIRLVGVSW